MANTPSTFEQKWPTVILAPITVANHVITVSDTAGLHTKAKITLAIAGQPQLDLEIKRVLNNTQIQVGLEADPINKIQNPVAYNGGMLTMSEQNRNKFGSEIVLRAVYEEEPATALRNLLVSKYGQPIDTVTDLNGINRLAVDGQFTATVDVQVEVDIDGQYDLINNPDPDDVGLIVSTRNTSPGKPNQIQRLTAKPGTVNTDVVALDVSLHDPLGNNYTYLNPVPTNKTNQLVPENHDDIVIVRDANQAVASVTYKLAGNVVAVVTIDRDVNQSVSRVYRSA